MTRPFCLRAFAFPFGAALWAQSLPDQSSDQYAIVRHSPWRGQAGRGILIGLRTTEA